MARTRTDEEQRHVETLYRERALDMATGMRMVVGRIGYPDEGLRLTFSIHCPYDFHAEVQLSRADAESLVEQVNAWLNDPRQANLQNGKR
jgi:hypothetical protein